MSYIFVRTAALFSSKQVVCSTHVNSSKLNQTQTSCKSLLLTIQRSNNSVRLVPANNCYVFTFKQKFCINNYSAVAKALSSVIQLKVTTKHEATSLRTIALSGNYK